MRFRIPGRQQTGFTLIEVLIAVIVLSIGLLGFAGLQLSSLRNSNSSYTRAQAVTLSYDIVDRMRANIIGFHCGFYNSGGVETGALKTETGIESDCNAVSNSKVIQALAQTDLREWNNRIKSDAEFPKAEGLVTCNSAELAAFPDYVQKQFTALSCTGNIQYVVAIKWEEASRDYQDTSDEPAPKVLAVATGFRP